MKVAKEKTLHPYLREDVARAQLQQRLTTAHQQRLAHYVVRLAQARRAQRTATRKAESAQLRLRLGSKAR